MECTKLQLYTVHNHMSRKLNGVEVGRGGTGKEGLNFDALSLFRGALIKPEFSN